MKYAPKIKELNIRVLANGSVETRVGFWESGPIWHERSINILSYKSGEIMRLVKELEEAMKSNDYPDS